MNRALDGYPTGPVYDREATGLTYDEWLYEQDADRAWQLEDEAEKQQAAKLDALWQAYRKAFDEAIFAELDWTAQRITIAKFTSAKAQARATQDAYIEALKRLG